MTTALGIAELGFPKNIEAKIAIRPTLCWEWTGARNRSGYCVACLNGRTWQAHRLVYELFWGYPPALPLDHLCRNRACVHPEHVEPVTSATNTARSPFVGMANRSKTHCPKGHPYDAANTRFDREGGRRCRLCAVDAHRRYEERKVRP